MKCKHIKERGGNKITRLVNQITMRNIEYSDLIFYGHLRATCTTWVSLPHSLEVKMFPVRQIVLKRASFVKLTVTNKTIYTIAELQI